MTTQRIGVVGFRRASEYEGDAIGLFETETALSTTVKVVVKPWNTLEVQYRDERGKSCREVVPLGAARKIALVRHICQKGTMVWEDYIIVYATTGDQARALLRAAA